MIRFLQTPTKAKKIILTGILLFIAAAMVISFIPGINSDPMTVDAGVVAEVGGETVTALEVEAMATRIGRQRFQRGFPDSFRPFLRQQAMEQLVMLRSFEAEARRMGLRVSDAELLDELRQGQLGQVLYPSGEYIGTEGYQAFVRNNFDLGVRDFEKLVKQEILVRKLRAVIEGAAVVPASAIEQEYRRRNTKVKFDYALISGDDVMKQINPTEAELRAFYDASKQRYENSIPEKRKVQLAVLDPAKLGGDVQVTEDDIRRAYDERKEQFRIADTADVRHILIKTPPAGADGKVDEKAVQQARAKAEDVLKQLKGGAKFEELAAKYSDDPGSKDNGGLYQGVTRGQMVPEFNQATFSQPVGQVGEPVKTDFGFHIIRVDKRQDGGVRPLAEVRAQLMDAARQQKQASTLQRAADAFLTEARTTGLEQAAQKRGVAVHNSDFIAAFEPLPGLGVNPEVSQAVFATRDKAGPQEARTQNGLVVFEVKEIRPPATPTFEEGRARVAGDYKNERAGELLAQRSRELADRARALHNLRAAAKELGAAVRGSELVSPESQVSDLGPMSGAAGVVFSMKPGQISDAISAGRNGAVLAVTEVQEPSMEQLAAARGSIREQLMEQKRQEMFSVFAISLRKRMESEGKIKYNEDARKRLLGSAGETAGS